MHDSSTARVVSVRVRSRKTVTTRSRPLGPPPPRRSLREDGQVAGLRRDFQRENRGTIGDDCAFGSHGQQPRVKNFHLESRLAERKKIIGCSLRGWGGGIALRWSGCSHCRQV